MEPQDAGNGISTLSLSDLKSYISDFLNSLAVHAQNEVRLAPDKFQKRLCESFLDFLDALIKMGKESNLMEDIKAIVGVSPTTTTAQPKNEEVKSSAEIEKLKQEISDLNEKFLSQNADKDKIQKENEDLLKKCDKLKSELKQHLSQSLKEQELTLKQKQKDEEESLLQSQAADKLLKLQAEFSIEKRQYKERIEEINALVDMQAKTIDGLSKENEKNKRDKEALQGKLDVERENCRQVRNQLNEIRSQKDVTSVSLKETGKSLLSGLFTSFMEGVGAKFGQTAEQPPEKPLLNILDYASLQYEIKSKVIHSQIERLTSKFKLQAQFASSEFCDYGTFKALKTPFFLIAHPTSNSYKYTPNQVVCVYLNLTDFNWREMSVFQWKNLNKVIVIEEEASRPSIKSASDIEIKFNYRKYEITLQKKGDIATEWFIDLNSRFEIFTLN